MRMELHCVDRAGSVPCLGHAHAAANALHMRKPSWLGASFGACGSKCIVQTELVRCLFWRVRLQMHCAQLPNPRLWHAAVSASPAAVRTDIRVRDWNKHIFGMGPDQIGASIRTFQNTCYAWVKKFTHAAESSQDVPTKGKRNTIDDEHVVDIKSPANEYQSTTY